MVYFPKTEHLMLLHDICGTNYIRSLKQGFLFSRLPVSATALMTKLKTKTSSKVVPNQKNMQLVFSNATSLCMHTAETLRLYTKTIKISAASFRLFSVDGFFSSVPHRRWLQNQKCIYSRAAGTSCLPY